MLPILFYLFFQNIFTFGEGEHLHGEAFEVGWDGNSAVAHNRGEDGHISVIVVLTAVKYTFHVVKHF